MPVELIYIKNEAPPQVVWRGLVFGPCAVGSALGHGAWRYSCGSITMLTLLAPASISLMKAEILSGVCASNKLL